MFQEKAWEAFNQHNEERNDSISHGTVERLKFCSALLCSALLCSVMLYYILLCSDLFCVLLCALICSTLFCSVIFCSALLCSDLFCSVLLCALICSNLFCSVVFLSFLFCFRSLLLCFVLFSSVMLWDGKQRANYISTRLIYFVSFSLISFSMISQFS